MLKERKRADAQDPQHPAPGDSRPATLNEIVPDAAAFLADMPALEDRPPAEPKVPMSSPDGVAEHAAEDVIPDAAAFLMDGFSADIDDLPSDDGAADPLEQASSPPQMVLPSAALTPSKTDLHDGLPADREADRRHARLGFHVGGLRFVVSFDDASELSEMVAIYRLPNVPFWFRGLANLHGNLVPVFDVAAMIDARPAADKGRMLLVLGHEARAAGILVNELPKRIRLESATAIAAPQLPDQLKNCVSRAYLYGDEIWLELQYQRFFETAAEKLAS